MRAGRGSRLERAARAEQDGEKAGAHKADATKAEEKGGANDEQGEHRE